MKLPYSRYFPTPSFLAMNSCALDISDQSIKYGELVATAHGLRLGRFGHEKIPPGVINSGKIENEGELVRILQSLAKRESLNFVRISLPEEQMYLFTLSLPKSTIGDLSEVILLQIEEHIPLKAIDTIFDYEIVAEKDQNIFVQVSAIAIATMESYLSVFKKAGLVPLSFELEAQAIARAVIPFNDPSPVMIVDFGSARTGASIAHNNKVFFTTTLDIGGVAITNMIAKNFNISTEEAEKMKLSYGLNSTSNADDIFPAILNGISVLRDELNRHYIYWKTHEDDGFKHEKLDRIILCGGDANLTGLSNYLESSMMIKVENANTWVNISDMKISVPSMSFEESFGYATVLGLALADYIQKPQSMISVLPKEDKKQLRYNYWMRFSTAILSFLTLSFVVAILLILPSYFFSISKLNIATNNLESFNIENPEVTTNNIDKSIGDINSKLTLLSSKESKLIPSDTILNDLLSTLPKGVTVSQIFYNEGVGGIRNINIQGQALDRNTLRNLKTSLESNPNITSSNLPLSGFLEKSNINFSISIVMK
jgi:type IV pilus assembly protein PilM